MVFDLAEPLMEALSELPEWGKWIATVLIAMLPIIELRGALPAAHSVFGLSWGAAYFLSVLGNLIPVPFLLRWFPSVEKWLRRWRPFEIFFEWLFTRTHRKGWRKVKIYGDVGLIFFVAIPLPITGAWTGTVLAYLFRINRYRAFVAITMGVLIAGVIMIIVTYSGYLIGGIIIMGLIAILAIMGMIERRIVGDTFDPPTPEV
jgi:uncharacterized membrane protein